MPERTAKPRKGGRRYRIEMTPLSIFFWSFGLLFLLSWIFVLGVMVGRGFMPEAVTAIYDLKGQISRLQDRVNGKRADEITTDGEDSEPKLAFYDRLSSKKEEAIKMQQPRPEPKAESKSPAPVLSGRYTVQFASLGERGKADEMVRRLISHGHPAFCYEVEIKGRRYFRVRSKNVMDRQGAQEYASRLEREERIKGLVVRVD